MRVLQATSNSCTEDNELLAEWNALQRLGRAPKTTKCIWLQPAPNQIKIHIDGAGRGNPGPSGYGIAVRNHMEAMELAVEEDWPNVWIEYDAAVTVANEGSMHWKLKGRFEVSKGRIARLHYEGSKLFS
ncbi:hypothetical protein IFM89_010893 [Coptis chinensis]|uniref:RNase H type-1 domain-containing protein n=1 Tax=Coptis chinensis TaxID=261450 RepID=A0A835HZW8_9MAGN|nr:hypothetical protein IFM89_010893 [Coptis chinensis]